MKLLQRLEAALLIQGYQAASGPDQWDGFPYQMDDSDGWAIGYDGWGGAAGLFVRLDNTSGFLEFECRSGDGTYITYNNPTSVSEIGQFDLETPDDADGEQKVAQVIAQTLFCLGYDIDLLLAGNPDLSFTQHQRLEAALRFKGRFGPEYWPSSWKEAQ